MMNGFARKALPMLLSAVAFAASGGASAQVDANTSGASAPAPSSSETPGRTAPADAYGTQRGGVFVAPSKFAGPLSGASPLVYESVNFFKHPSSTSPVRYFAPVDGVPVGSVVDGFTCVYRDTSASNDVTFTFQKAEQQWSFLSNTGGSRTNSAFVSFTSSGTPGVSYEFVDLPTSETITHFLGFTGLRQYYLTADLAADTSFAGCYVFYTRQISPAPGAASFSDVPVGHPFFQVIEALKASGVTAGCTATTFCPDAPVTRAAMAAFLARALGLAFPL